MKQLLTVKWRRRGPVLITVPTLSPAWGTLHRPWAVLPRKEIWQAQSMDPSLSLSCSQASAALSHAQEVKNLESHLFLRSHSPSQNHFKGQRCVSSCLKISSWVQNKTHRPWLSPQSLLAELQRIRSAPALSLQAFLWCCLGMNVAPTVFVFKVIQNSRKDPNCTLILEARAAT